MESTSVAVTKQVATVLGLDLPVFQTVTNKVSCPVLVGASCLDQNVRRLFNFSFQQQIARKSSYRKIESLFNIKSFYAFLSKFSFGQKFYSDKLFTELEEPFSVQLKSSDLSEFDLDPFIGRSFDEVKKEFAKVGLLAKFRPL